MSTRDEAVRLRLIDQGFSTGMARAAAKTALLEKELDDLDGVTLRAQTTIGDTSREVDGFGRTLRASGADIDRYSGRLGLLAQGAAALGPSFIPIGAVAVPAVAGLASQLGFAALGAGTLVTAFNGVGDALEAVNEAALDPTAGNLEAAAEAMRAIGPDAQRFVARFQELRPVLGDIRDAAAEGWFPGLTEALDDLEAVAPQIESIFAAISGVGGNLVAEAGSQLSGSEWGEFLDFVERNAPAALDELGRSIGNVVRGMAELWQAFDPLADDFSGWLLDTSRAFVEWSDSLSQTEGFREFVQYVRESGPQVADAFGAIGDAVVQITQAAAPLGGPVLQSIESLAEALAFIADSPIGTPLAGAVTTLSAVSLASRGVASSLDAVGVSSGRARRGLSGLNAVRLTAVIAAAGALSAGLSKAASVDLDTLNRDLRTLGNTGGGSENIDEIGHSLAVLNGSATDFWRTWSSGWETALAGGGLFGDTAWDTARDNIDQVDQVLADMVRSGDLEQAQQLFGQLALVAGENGVATSELSEQLDDYGLALDAAAEKTDGQTTSQRRQVEAMKASRAAARETANQFITLGDSLDDAETSLGEWLTELEKQAQALRNFRVNAEKAANRGLRQGLIKALQEAGPAGARRMRQLANASDKEIDRANRAWKRGQDQIKKYSREVGKVPKNKSTNIKVNGVPQALGAIRRLRREIVGNPITQRVQVQYQGTTYDVQNQSQAPSGLTGLLGGSADGSTVPGPRQPYRDSVPTLLAPGEEVISNRHGQADRHRELLKAINSNRLADGGTVERRVARVPAMANGGTVRMVPPPAPRTQVVQVPTPAADSGRSALSLAPGERMQVDLYLGPDAAGKAWLIGRRRAEARQ